MTETPSINPDRSNISPSIPTIEESVAQPTPTSSETVTSEPSQVTNQSKSTLNAVISRQNAINQVGSEYTSYASEIKETNLLLDRILNLGESDTLDIDLNALLERAKSMESTYSVSSYGTLGSRLTALRGALEEITDSTSSLSLKLESIQSELGEIKELAKELQSLETEMKGLSGEELDAKMAIFREKAEALREKMGTVEEAESLYTQLNEQEKIAYSLVQSMSETISAFFGQKTKLLLLEMARKINASEASIVNIGLEKNDDFLTLLADLQKKQLDFSKILKKINQRLELEKERLEKENISLEKYPLLRKLLS